MIEYIEQQQNTSTEGKQEVKTYESISVRKRKERTEKICQLYDELNSQGITRMELWCRMEEAIGVNTQTIRRYLKQEGKI